MCWKQFKKGKNKQKDVQIFERHLEDNIFMLHHELKSKTYIHDTYHQFYVTDPKKRQISKASVRDRLVHHVVYKVLHKIFDPTFIFHSYACRIGKGLHKGVSALNKMLRQASKNNSSSCYVLKMDIKRFFDTVNHNILKKLLAKRMKNKDTLDLAYAIINSFSISNNTLEKCGLPLGNVTSQIFANIYLHEYDKFVKHEIKEPFYIRYSDDFVIVSSNTFHLENILPKIVHILKIKLSLTLHPQKIFIRKWASGIDFLGYVSFPYYQLMRTTTRKRMCHRLKQNYDYCLTNRITLYSFAQSLQSYLGVLKYTNQLLLKNTLMNEYYSEIGLTL